VTDASTGAALSSISVTIYTSSGVFAGSGSTDATGVYEVTSLPSGTYYARTSASFTANYLDELFDNHPCVSCNVTLGTPITVTAGTTRGGVDFGLLPGARITGVVTDSVTTAPLEGVTVQIYTSSGGFAGSGSTNATGVYTVTGLAAGTYYARTFASFTANYVDELFDDIPCLNCLVTSGRAMVLTAGATRSGVDFALSPGGRITGTVTNEGTGDALSSVSVTIYTSNGTFAATAATTATGSYTVNGLPTGSYYARTFVFGTLPYVDELFDNLPCLNCNVTTGTPIVLTAGTTRSGVDFALLPGGRITGVVTDGGTTAALAGVTVQIYTASEGFAGSGFTDATGAYAVERLPADTYYARTFVSGTLNYVDELYHDMQCLSCSVITGTPVVVTAGTTRSSVDFALSLGGRITGLVTDAGTGTGLENVNVAVYTSSGTFAIGTTTNATGSYTVNGLPEGTYFARTFASFTTNYLDELYEDMPCLNCSVTSGTAIVLTGGTTREGVNFALLRGGRITGTVTDESTGAGLPSVSVAIFTSSGTFATSTLTAGSGSYTVNGLPAGTYFARTFAFGTVPYVDELYDDIPCLNCDVTTGTAIVLTAGTTRSGVNFGLAPGGRITGTVTDEGTGTGLSSVFIYVYTSSGTFATSAFTSETGSFTVNGLPAGTYYVRTALFGALNYVDELYDNTPCLNCSVTSGAAIVLTAGSTRSGVDFALLPGGRITGLVTDVGTGAGLENVSVAIYTSNGTFAMSAATSGTGSFTINGLPAGSYYARTFVSGANYLDQLYDNIPCLDCVVTAGTPIAVTVGTTRSGVNFALAQGGRITGTVTDGPTGTGLENVFVRVYTSSGTFARSALTTSTGSYTANGLPEGTYYARTFASATLNYTDELYDDIPCLSCSVRSGTAIVLTAGATRSGVNFALLPGGRITGTVTDESTGVGLFDVIVGIYTSSGTFLTSASTTATGSYTVNGLPAGNYFARTFAFGTLPYVDELYPDIRCLDCVVTAGTTIAVTAGTTRSGIDFALLPGGRITGTVADEGTGAGLAGISVQIYTSSGTFATSAPTGGTGSYASTGLPPGTYYARTVVPVTLNYTNELYSNNSCINCDVTSGTAIQVVAAGTLAGVDFSLAFNTNPTATPMVAGTRHNFSLAHGDADHWVAIEAVAGRSYCALLASERTAVDRATPSIAAFRADAATGLGTREGGGTPASCFVAPATERALFRVRQLDAGSRVYVLSVQETTIWANWFFVGGDYSSYTILRNVAARTITATITWRSLNGDIVNSEMLSIPAGGVVFRDARSTVGAASAGSVEVGFAGPPESLRGTQSTISVSTGQSFDTIFVARDRW
jgi:hypothetical protein